jgi:hypothetical protein
LVRDSLARRFPHLGFERQQKVEATGFYASLIFEEGGEVWRHMGRAWALASLGIIDEQGLRPALEQLLARRQVRDAHRVWGVLNLESWVRAHVP